MAGSVRACYFDMQPPTDDEHDVYNLSKVAKTSTNKLASVRV